MKEQRKMREVQRRKSVDERTRKKADRTRARLEVYSSGTSDEKVNYVELNATSRRWRLSSVETVFFHRLFSPSQPY
jgi:hypothetical protein